MGKYSRKKVPTNTHPVESGDKSTSGRSQAKFRYAYRRFQRPSSTANLPTPPSMETNEIDHTDVQRTIGEASGWITTDQLENAREKPRKRQTKAGKPEFSRRETL
jgi:hypothetical protein